jgi:hypothetical protein
VSLLKKVGKLVKKVGVAATGFATGGPLGAIAAIAAPPLSKQAPSLTGVSVPQALALPTVMPGLGTIASQVGKVLARAPAPAALGFAAGQMVPSQVEVTGDGSPGCACQKVLASGKIRRGRIGADGRCHFPRRINPANHRATRRALRRVKTARKFMQAIERELPRRAAPARRSK